VLIKEAWCLLAGEHSLCFLQGEYRQAKQVPCPYFIVGKFVIVSRCGVAHGLAHELPEAANSVSSECKMHNNI